MIVNVTRCAHCGFEIMSMRIPEDECPRCARSAGQRFPRVLRGASPEQVRAAEADGGWGTAIR